jgi:hypothetical protein
MSVYWFPGDAIINSNKLGGLNDRKILSHYSGAWKYKTKVQWDWFLLRTVREVCFPGLYPWLIEGHLPSFFMASSLYEYLCVQISPLCKDCSMLDEGLTLMISLHHDIFWYLCKESVSKQSHIMRYWELGLQHRNSRGTQLNS